MTPLVSVWRGDFLESVHYGSIAIVDSTGRLLAWAGEPNHQTFIRSSAKPFQAIPLVMEGGIEEYDLSTEELALVCASHGGEARHVSTAAALLRKGDFDEDDLLCGTHTPFDERTAAELRASGEAPSPLHSNCSGKHAGMLLASRLLDFPPASYVDIEHPLQRQILQVLADFAGLDPGEVGVGIDGCGVPTFYLPIHRTAFAFARLTGMSSGDSNPALPRYAEAAKEIFDAMTLNPDYVAGAWSMTTPLMKAFEGRLLAKEGAEGFYAMGLDATLSAPILERLGLDEGPSIGIALKISDGSMTRGRDPAVLRTLEQLGLPIDSETLATYRDRRIKNCAGIEVGRVRSEFELEFF